MEITLLVLNQAVIKEIKEKDYKFIAPVLSVEVKKLDM